MIGIDTNVLVRYITQDDQQQSKKASHFIETQLTKESPGIISKIVLCEWLGCYQLPTLIPKTSR